jgi:hypothetical protein
LEVLKVEMMVGKKVTKLDILMVGLLDAMKVELLSLTRVDMMVDDLVGSLVELAEKWAVLMVGKMVDKLDDLTVEWKAVKLEIQQVEKLE